MYLSCIQSAKYKTKFFSTILKLNIKRDRVRREGTRGSLLNVFLPPSCSTCQTVYLGPLQAHGATELCTSCTTESPIQAAEVRNVALRLYNKICDKIAPGAKPEVSRQIHNKVILRYSLGITLGLQTGDPAIRPVPDLLPEYIGIMSLSSLP